MSQREAARHFGVSRDTVRKMMSYSVPPGYRRQAPVRRPKLDPFIGIIDQWLDGDQTVPRKQRHTAKRVFDRLRDECGFTGGYTIIKDYMRERDRRGQEVFVPLAHPAGHGQADFGEAVVVIGGIEQKAHFFVLDLPHSDACYVRAYAGKAQRLSLWKEMNNAFNRDRGEVQNIKRVAHPYNRVKYRAPQEQRRQITKQAVPLHDVASYCSAYEVPDQLIGKFEALIVRAFANDLLNVRMENF